MKRIAAVTAAAVMVFGVTAYLPCSRVSAAEGEECFADRGVFLPQMTVTRLMKKALSKKALPMRISVM